MMESERYSFCLTTFSPNGHLVQMEYASAAVQNRATSVGIKAKNGVVIATQYSKKTPLRHSHSVNKIEKISEHAGATYSGLAPDYRCLMKRARKMSAQYSHLYREKIPCTELIQRISNVMQEHTQTGGVRPFGVSLLVCGWDVGRPYLFQCDPLGVFRAWKATAVGLNSEDVKAYLEQRFNDNLEVDAAVKLAISSLKLMFSGEMTSENVQVGVCDAKGFRNLRPKSVADYFARIT